MKQLLLGAVLLLQQAIPATTGTVNGTVFYSDGTPAAGIVLRFVPTVDPGQQAAIRATATSTDSDGTYSRRLNPGRYIIQTSVANPTFYPGVLSQSSATAVLVTAGTTTTGLNFTLPPSASGVRVQGRVLIPAGYPNPGSTLRVFLTAIKPIAADGTFEFTHVMPGKYPLSVSAPGAQPVILAVSDRDIEGIEVPIPPVTSVQSVVSLEGTGTKPRFSLSIESLFPPPATPAMLPAGPYRTTVTPQADGSTSTLLPPGEYRVSVVNLPAGYYIKAISANSKDLLGSFLKIAPADPPVRVSITAAMSSGVRVAGLVTRADSDRALPLPEKVVFNGAAGGDLLEAAVHPDGAFEFPRLVPGTYYARAMVTPTVSSQPIPIVISNRDTLDLAIPAPGARELFGKVAVNGNGPPPRFSLLLTQDAKSLVETRQGELPSIPVSSIINPVLGGGFAGSPVLQLDVNALPDGSFSVRIPDGEYRAVALPAGLTQANGIPPAYFVRSLTSNSGDLMKEPLRVSDKETPEIHIGFGTTATNPWVKVSGRVKGFNPTRGGLKVALESSTTSTMETFVDAEGKFEFPVVLQRTRYTARLIPPDDAASMPRVMVENSDITGVEIVAPPKREVTARVVVEEGYPVPGVGLNLNAKDSAMIVVIRPESDGTSRIKLPEDERTVRVNGLPFGYSVKAMTYGSTDLLKQPLKLGESITSELKITLAVDPSIPSGSVRGKVTGLDPEKESVRIVLNGVAAFSRFDVALNADGSFNFAKLPQGTYVPSLEGGGVATSLTPTSITIDGTDLAGLEFSAQAGAARSGSVETAPKGATLADFGGSGRSAANESAAVANLRTINTAMITFLSASGGRYGTLEDLISAGLLDGSFKGTKSGFNYSLIAIGSDYMAASIPANSATGRYGFYSTPDAIIRYSTFEMLAPPQQTGRAVQ